MQQSQAEIELAKIKAQNKARQARYLEKRKAEGKMHLSAMVSGKTYDKLCKIRDQSIQEGEKKNLGEVLDELLNYHTATGQDQGSRTREEPINAIADQTVQDAADHMQNHPPSPIEIQAEIPAPKMDKAEILEIIKSYHDAGATWGTIAEQLNGQGLTTARGKTWAKANAQTFYTRNKPTVRE